MVNRWAGKCIGTYLPTEVYLFTPRIELYLNLD